MGSVSCARRKLAANYHLEKNKWNMAINQHQRDFVGYAAAIVGCVIQRDISMRMSTAMKLGAS